MYELTTKEKVTRYINEQFLLNEENFFDEEGLGRRIINVRIENIFHHFLGVEVDEHDELILNVPNGLNHVITIDSYNIIKDIKYMDELIYSLRSYQLIICEVLQEVQKQERMRLSDAYENFENNNELER